MVVVEKFEKKGPSSRWKIVGSDYGNERTFFEYTEDQKSRREVYEQFQIEEVPLPGGIIDLQMRFNTGLVNRTSSETFTLIDETEIVINRDSNVAGALFKGSAFRIRRY